MVNTWDEEDNKFLMENYSKLSYTAMADALHVCRETVINHARALGLPTKRVCRPQSWSEEEIKLLHELYDTHTEAEIAEKLGKSKKAIMSKIHREGLYGRKREKVMTQWKQEEIDFLKLNYEKFTNRQLSLKLNRSEKDIAFVAAELGLKKTYCERSTGKKGAKTEAASTRRETIKRKAEKPFYREFDLKIGDIVLAPFAPCTTNDDKEKKRKFEVVGIYPNLINCKLIGSHREKGFPRSMYTCGQIKKVGGGNVK